MPGAEPASVLDDLRAGHTKVRSDTWENEAELMSLLDEVVTLHWDCFSRLEGHEMTDDVERALVYLSAAAFHSLQSCFNLVELGYYRQAIVGTRALMNEYLLCRLFTRDPQCATDYLRESDWDAVRAFSTEVLAELDASDTSAPEAVTLLSAALDERLSWSAYVAVEHMQRSKALSKELKTKLNALRDELTKDRTPGMTNLLRRLGKTYLTPAKILGYRADLELLHRHAHSAWVAIRAEVLARDEAGGQWITPRYDQGRCRYCGYRVGLWSAAVLWVLTGHFERLDGDDPWKDRLATFQEALLRWGRQAHLELTGATP